MNALPLLFAQPWAERLAWTLVHFLWQGTAIALLYAPVRRAAAVTSQTRYALGCMALAAMTAAPLVTYAWLSVPAPAGPASVAAGSLSLPAAAASWPASSGAWEQALPWIVMAWLAGVAAFSLRLAAGWLSSIRLHSALTLPAPPEWQCTLDRLIARLGIARPVGLLLSGSVESPSVIGWLRPVILAPAGLLAALPAAHVEALLLHELAHIRRHDFLVNLLQGVAESVLFYHPAVWWISRQIRIEREHCCDDVAVTASGDVLTYTRALVELESARPAHSRAALAASGGSLVDRIRRLLDPGRPAPATSAAWAVNILLLLAIGGFAVRGAQDVPLSGAPRDAVARASIWTDTAKQGDLKLAVAARGAIVSATSAEFRVAQAHAQDVHLGQPVAIGFPPRKDTISGKVLRIPSPAANGILTVDVTLDQPLPPGVELQSPADCVITVGRVNNVVYVGRPVNGQANSDSSLFKIEPDGQHAVRVKVHFGAASINQIEVKSGLQPGDKVIVSDMRAYKDLDRVELR